MERKAHVSYDFKQMNPAEKVLFGNNVHALLNEHSLSFPNLPVLLPQLSNANGSLDTKYQEYKLYGAIAKGAFLEAEEIWKELFGKTADYVDMMADGSVAIINLSGFHITKTETTPAEQPGAPVAEIYSGREKGSVVATAKPIKGVRGYLFSMVTDDVQVEVTGNQITLKLGNSFATFIIGTQRDVLFQNLPSHVDVKATAAAFNSAGLGEFSNDAIVSIP